MADTIKITMQGDRELMNTLDALPLALRDHILVKAVRKSARPILTAAKALVPVKLGHLKRSLDVKVKAYKNSGNVVAVIGPRTRDRHTVTDELTGKSKVVFPAKYAHLVEYGTQPHHLGKDSQRVRRVKRGGKQVEIGPGKGTGRMHPGARAKPFLRPAVHAAAPQTMAILEQEIRAGLAKVADERARGRGRR